MSSKLSSPNPKATVEPYERFTGALQQVGLDIGHLNHDQSFTRTQIVSETIDLALELGKPINLTNPDSQALLSLARDIENGTLVEKAKQTSGVGYFGTGVQMLNAVSVYLRQEYKDKKDEAARTLVAFADTLRDMASVDEQDRLVAGTPRTSRGNAAATPLQPFYQALATHARIAALALALQK